MTKVLKVTFQIEVDSVYPEAYLEDLGHNLTIEDLVNQANEDRWSDDDQKALRFLLKKACRLDDGLDHGVTKDLVAQFEEAEVS